MYSLLPPITHKPKLQGKIYNLSTVLDGHASYWFDFSKGKYILTFNETEVRTISIQDVSIWQFQQELQVRNFLSSHDNRLAMAFANKVSIC